MRKIDFLAESASWRNKPSHILVFVACLLAVACAPTVLEAAPQKGMLTFAPSAVDFGSLKAGNKAAISFYVMNMGPGTVTINQKLCYGEAFIVTELSLPYRLPPGRRIALTVIFAPAIAGHFNGAIKFVSDAANSLVSYSLTGNALQTPGGALSLTPNSVSFGSIPVGSKNSLAIQLENKGVTNVTVTGASVTNSKFMLEGLSTPLVLKPGQIVDCTLFFAPSSTGYLAGSVSITSSAIDSSLTLTASGSGVAATRLLTVNPTVLNFGNENVGNSRTLPVTITNGGNSNIQILNIATTSKILQIGGDVVGATIAPGQAATLDIAFSPKGPGSASGIVTIQSNATNSPTTIQVSATGVSLPSGSPGEHSVNLSWQASESPNVVGYYVYRSSGTSTIYTRMVTTPQPELSYTDASVLNGQTYSYAVTALDSTGHESSYSNLVTVSVP